jgi:DNA-binding NarL/FixJ family response regulator
VSRSVYSRRSLVVRAPVGLLRRDDHRKEVVPTRQIIADDDPTFLRMLRRLVEIDARLQIVGEAVDGDEAIRLALESRPDAVLLDLQMPNTDGLDAAVAIQRARPGTSIMIHSAGPSRQSIARVRASGFGIRDKSDLSETMTALASP